jgi:hypothetical protein
MAFSSVLLEAQNAKTISADLDPEMLAENIKGMATSDTIRYAELVKELSDHIN